MKPVMYIAKAAFFALSAIGKPFGGIRPRRIYDIIGRKAWTSPAYRWHRNQWGDELWISPHQHFDRCVLAFGCYDPDLHWAIERLLKPGMTCLDVGANFGEIAMHMARLVGQAGTVHAFEPAPSQFERLSQHVDHNHSNVQCHPIAMSDHSGIAPMAVPTIAADNQGLGTIIGSMPARDYITKTVQLTTLDDFAIEHGLTRLDFVKLDIQGAEPMFIRGGTKTIRRFMPLIISEVSHADLAASGYTSREYCEMLTSIGYSIRRMTRHGIGRQIEVIQDDFESTNIIFMPPRLGASG